MTHPASAGLLAVLPATAFVLIIWAKLSYFNFPPAERLGTDWVGWSLKEAVQAWIGTLAALLILLSPALLLRPLARYLVLGLIDLFVTIVVIADILHFRFYGDVMSVSALPNAGQVTGVMESVFELVRPSDALLVVDLIVAVALFLPYRRACARHPDVWGRSLRPLLGFSLMAGIVLLIVAPVRIVALDRGDTFRYNYFRLFGVRKIGLLNYHAYEAGKRYVQEFVAGVDVGPEERARALDYVGRWRSEAAAPSALFGAAHGRNVVFLMLESFHAFPIGLTIDGQEVTPALTALARRSLHFENFYGQTWEGTTSDGEFTSLQSLHPLPTGAVATTFPHHNFRGVPAVLTERGYATASAHAYFGTLWNMQEMHPRLGFQRSYFRESYEIDEEIGMGMSDMDFVRQTVPKLRELPQPFMAYLMTLTSHHPFNLPAKYRRLRLGQLDGTTLGGYLHSVHYTDAAVGELVRLLEREGLWDETVLVVYGDHKTEFGTARDLEQLLTRHAKYRMRRPGFDPLYWREQNRLPLLIRLPGDAHAGVVASSAGHLDIAPTVLNLLGVANHEMISLGSDLTHGKDSFVIMRNGSFVLADTVCVTPDADIPASRCGTITGGTELDPVRFTARFEEARERLEISDLILRGDLIPRR